MAIGHEKDDCVSHVQEKIKKEQSTHVRWEMRRILKIMRTWFLGLALAN